jgi:hypothetical protein
MPSLTLSPSDFELTARHGHVMGSKTWSETHVSAHSSGGGDGYAPRMSVSSTATTKHQFFLRDAAGVERSANLIGNASMRDGQVVTVVYVGRTGADRAYPFYFKNHTSGDGQLEPSGFEHAAGKIGCGMVALLLLGLPFVGFWIGMLLGVRDFMFVGALGGFAYGFYVLRRRHNQWSAVPAALKPDAIALAEAEAAKSGLKVQ